MNNQNKILILFQNGYKVCDMFKDTIYDDEMTIEEWIINVFISNDNRIILCLGKGYEVIDIMSMEKNVKNILLI